MNLQENRHRSPNFRQIKLLEFPRFLLPINRFRIFHGRLKRLRPAGYQAVRVEQRSYYRPGDETRQGRLAAVALYVAHYNLCRVHEALKMTPAKAIGVVDRAWAIGDLIDAALATQPIAPVPTAPDRRKRFTVIEGGKN
jgi:hypothetical protein